MIGALNSNSTYSLKIAILSSYVPAKCEVAHFSYDLGMAINQFNQYPVTIIALEDFFDTNLTYPAEVKYLIKRDKYTTYTDVADQINKFDVDALLIQHEYGLFGGEESDYLLKMIDYVKTPIFITCHTVLKSPSDSQKTMMQHLAVKSQKIIVMASNAKEILMMAYNIHPNKIEVIQHGVNRSTLSKDISKIKIGVDSPILLMTGVINPDKGVDDVISAMPQILKQVPNAQFLMVGKPEAHTFTADQQSYTNQLNSLIQELKIEKNVKFINSQGMPHELLDYYSACDIYLTPHLNPRKVKSSTLAQAFGMGRAIISTPYCYAAELIGNNQNGKLVGFKNPAQIANKAIQLLTNQDMLKELEQKALGVGEKMLWGNVARDYLCMFTRTINYL